MGVNGPSVSCPLLFLARTFKQDRITACFQCNSRCPTQGNSAQRACLRRGGGHPEFAEQQLGSIPRGRRLARRRGRVEG